jgi:hypothetical protein
MGCASEIANPDDPNAWVQFLKENGVPIDTIGQAVDNLEVLAEPVADYVFASSVSTDPIAREQVFGLPDERQFGADVAMPVQSAMAAAPVVMEEVVTVIAAAPVRRPRRTPVTPDGA